MEGNSSNRMRGQFPQRRGGESKYAQGFRVSLTNAQGRESYPIASFTWLYVPERANDPARGKAVNLYLQWVYGAGQGLRGRGDMRRCRLPCWLKCEKKRRRSDKPEAIR